VLSILVSGLISVAEPTLASKQPMVKTCEIRSAEAKQVQLFTETMARAIIVNVPQSVMPTGKALKSRSGYRLVEVTLPSGIAAYVPEMYLSCK
jgi:hypothetical protein